MVTSPYAGHTYAEYAREASGSDDARVSRFGITVTSSSNAFAVSYKGAGDNSSKNTVSSSAKVFAPGTSGTLCTYNISGVSEVRTQVTKDATISMNDYWTNSGTGTSGTFYCPLVITFKSDSTTIKTINGLDYSSKADFIAAIVAEMEADNGTYGTNYDFARDANYQKHNRTVTWSWPFSGATGSAINQTQNNDNALGNKSTKPTFGVSFTLTVEQID